jgi:hypothetical protein
LEAPCIALDFVIGVLDERLLEGAFRRDIFTVDRWAGASVKARFEPAIAPEPLTYRHDFRDTRRGRGRGRGRSLLPVNPLTP